MIYSFIYIFGVETEGNGKGPEAEQGIKQEKKPHPVWCEVEKNGIFCK